MTMTRIGWLAFCVKELTIMTLNQINAIEFSKGRSFEQFYIRLEQTVMTLPFLSDAKISRKIIFIWTHFNYLLTLNVSRYAISIL